MRVSADHCSAHRGHRRAGRRRRRPPSRRRAGSVARPTATTSPGGRSPPRHVVRVTPTTRAGTRPSSRSASSAVDRARSSRTGRDAGRRRELMRRGRPPHDRERQRPTPTHLGRAGRRGRRRMRSSTPAAACGGDEIAHRLVPRSGRTAIVGDPLPFGVRPRRAVDRDRSLEPSRSPRRARRCRRTRWPSRRRGRCRDRGSAARACRSRRPRTGSRPGRASWWCGGRGRPRRGPRRWRAGPRRAAR